MMDLENITLNGNEEELKEKIIQLPRGFRNMEKTPAGVAKHSTGEIEIDFNEDRTTRKGYGWQHIHNPFLLET